MANKRPPTDWDAVERDYRTGQYTDRELGARYGVSHTAVQKHAKSGEWQKDLAGSIRAATAARVAEHEVRKVASDEVAKRVAKQVASALPATTEIVSVLSSVNASVEIRHRSDLRQMLDSAMTMLAELRQVGEHSETLEQIAEVLGKQDDHDENKLRAVLQRAISMPSRASSFKAIADTALKVMVSERENYRLDDDKPPGSDTPTLSDAERASRLATLLARARAAAGDAADS